MPCVDLWVPMLIVEGVERDQRGLVPDLLGNFVSILGIFAYLIRIDVASHVMESWNLIRDALQPHSRPYYHLTPPSPAGDCTYTPLV